MLKAAVKQGIFKVTDILSSRLKLSIAGQLRRIANILENGYYPVQRARVQQLIDCAVVSSNLGNYTVAEGSLLEAAKISPSDPQIAPHLGRVRFLQERSVDSEAKAQTKRMIETINAMSREIESDPVYVPGDYWGSVGKYHFQLLDQYGVENFKRTVSHHYQNWVMSSLKDSQVCQLFKTWPTHFRTEPWFNAIEIPNHVGMHFPWNFENPTYPLASVDKREIYRVAVGLLWEYVKNTDSFNILEQLTESEIGNPIRIWRKGQLISSDLAHSVRERNMLLESFSLKGKEGLVVGELGAGHGRLAEVFGRTTNFRYYIFDITPALFVSQWYIKKLFPKEKIFEFRHFDNFVDIREELQECRFAFFTSNQIEKLPSDSVDLFINMNSLQEMRMDQIKNFLSQIDRLTTKGFLSRQSIRLLNPLERILLAKANFAMNDRWQLVVDKTDDIYSDFFNQIWKR